MTNPEKVFKQGCCQAALFVNEIEKEGKKLQIGKITVQKTYMRIPDQSGHRFRLKAATHSGAFRPPVPE